MRWRLLFLFISISLPVSAESLSDALADLSGREVEITGYIGTGAGFGDDEDIAFRNEAGVYFAVVFDAGREARRALDGCKFTLFGGGTPCRIDGRAEIEMHGSQVRLIVFEVRSIAPPASLP